jgi:CRISPR-associated protein Csd2
MTLPGATEQISSVLNITKPELAVISNPGARHEFVLLFDVTNGNPNGDPDAMNSPRIDPETGNGLVTDVALKRKVRDFLALTLGIPMFIQGGVALNTLKSDAANRLDPPLTKVERESNRSIPRLQQRLCADYYDIRMFGAVLATGEKGDRLNAGQVRGPMQLTFARSIDPVLPMDVTITRQGRTTEERLLTGETEMGRKSIVPYGLYRAHGFFNPFFAEQTGVVAGDLESFWQALGNLFELERSASRGEMPVQGLVVFTHENKLGNAHAHRLFDRIEIARRDEVASPRRFADYSVTIQDQNLPKGISPTVLVDPRT